MKLGEKMLKRAALEQMMYNAVVAWRNFAILGLLNRPLSAFASFAADGVELEPSAAPRVPPRETNVVPQETYGRHPRRISVREEE